VDGQFFLASVKTWQVLRIGPIGVLDNETCQVAFEDEIGLSS
jgi:hypothetical protein